MVEKRRQSNRYKFDEMVRTRRLTVKGILAADHDGVIGYADKLLFHNKVDMNFFKNKTFGEAVLMGRKTFDSMGSRPLPGRLNIVLTRHPIEAVDSGIHFSNIECAFSGMGYKAWCTGLIFVNNLNAVAGALGDKYRTLYIIGGASLYDTMFYEMEDVYLTLYDTRLTYKDGGKTYGEIYGLFPDDYDPDEVVRTDLVSKLGALRSVPILDGELYVNGPESSHKINYSITRFSRPN